MEKPRMIVGQTLIAELIRLGVVPPDTKRFIIDAAAGEPVILYVEQYGDERIVDAFTHAGLQLRVAPEAPPEQECIPGTSIPVPRTHT